MSGPVIAIDGPSGAGKSTIAMRLAEELDLPHLDTGAFYRAVTLAVLRAGVDVSDPEACAAVARHVTIERDHGRTVLDGEDVEDEIRGPAVTEAVSTVSAHGPVREAPVAVQRAAARDRGGVVEGRDIGTVVLPAADVKLFLTASPQERARRRAEQQGDTDTTAVAAEMQRRDEEDSSRAVAPLAKPEDAWEIDTTGMDVEETVDAVAALVRALLDRELEESEVEAAEDGSAPGDVEATEEEREGPPVDQDGAWLEPDAGPDFELEDATAGAPTSTVLTTRSALPRVAVVGRPNVGKSTLVNRIIGHRAAIVEERPGVTRDRAEYLASWRGRPFLVIDTGGWEHDPEGLGTHVVQQAERAIETADLVVFVVDATVGALTDDELYARSLRRGEVPVVLAANKVDSPNQELLVHELYVLGIGEPHPISAQHGRGVGDLLDVIVDELPEGLGTEAPDVSTVPHVAVVGRPNVGKSSLFNRLIGEERSIVDAVPHTTRDAVDTVVEFDGEPWIFVDTAGLRRRYRHGEDTELYSVDRTRRAVEAADLVLFVVDASEELGEQDQRLAAMVRDAGCGVILVLNKWDLVDEERRPYLERELDRLLGFTAWAPRVNVSALTGRNVARLVPWLRQVWDAYRTRIPTAELNAWVNEATERTPPPPGRGNKRLRVKYVTQARSGPPTFVVFSNGSLPPQYLRYLERSLRERYDFVGTPIAWADRGGGRDRRR